ncbi:helix-turn-helix transcriptional regulator [Sabulicella rubraurantiaca]|uniref:helix-turn-helix transcriptional regulator n=1 Tax=Sabulicella rubraurantiaca TaxID=2811429 RepID=UPI001A966C48|nr:helix-turn-helix transcriptional regulator [Sabulicella rubraurantiaca]
MANRVQAWRKRLGWSQRDLASRARTSQQQIQRIECGAQAPRIGLAMRIAASLGRALDEVFPSPPEIGVPRQPQAADATGRVWTLSLSLRGGAAMRIILAPPELDRVRDTLRVPAEEGRFLVFASATHEVALRPDQVSLWRLLSGTASDAAPHGGLPPGQALVHLAEDPLPLLFTPEPDDSDIEDTEEGEELEACRNQGIMAALDMDALGPLSRLTALDARTGEMLGFLPRDLALLAMPFEALRPGEVGIARGTRPQHADNDA